MTRNWVLMDFDGTITKRDTTRYLLVELVKRRPWRVYALVRLIAARFSGNAAKLQYWKNRCIGTLLAGMTDEELQQVVEAFHRRVRPLFRSSVMNKLRESVCAGCGVMIVTASPEFAVRGLFVELGVDCVGTRYRKVGDTYSGDLDGSPCYGEAKVPAIREALERRGGYAEITAAWSDSLSDMPMMRLAEIRYWVGRDQRVLEEARRDDRAVVVEG